MTPSRQKALVTAAVSGPGLDLLGQLADLVLDSWLDQPTLRIYNASSWPSGWPPRAPRSSSSRATRAAPSSTSSRSPRSAAAGVTRRTSTSPAATAAGVPVLRAPGRNADAVAELAVALLFAATRGIVPADRDVREGEIYRDGKIPYQRYRAWELAGKTVGPGRPRRGRARPALAAARPRHGRAGLRPVRAGRHEHPRRPLRPRRHHLHPRAGDRGDHGHDRCGRLRQDARRRGLPEHGAREDPRHRRPRRRPGSRARSAPLASTTSRASSWRRTTR